MKVAIQIKSRRNESGSAFVMAMFLAFSVAGIAVSYLLATQQQYRLVDRSQTWNTALPTTEAGVEEAFAHLNADCYTNPANLTLNLANGGWTGTNYTYTNSKAQSGTAYGIVSPQRWIGSNYYYVKIITNATAAADSGITANSPQIVSVGSAPSRIKVGGSSYGARQVRVKSKLYFFNQFGLESLGDINSNGRGLTIKAFNPTNSWSGYYNSSNTTAQSGNIASVQGNITFNGQGTVDGNVFTDPYNSLTTNVNTTITGNYDSTLNTELLDPPFDASTTSGWTEVSQCNCVRSYVMDTNTPVLVSTNQIPNPIPPGGITTNENGLFTTTIWPTNLVSSGALTASSISTNTIHISGQTSTNATYTYFNLQTNGTGTYVTNWAGRSAGVGTSPLLNTFSYQGSHNQYNTTAVVPTSYAVGTLSEGSMNVGSLGGSPYPENYLGVDPPAACIVSGGFTYVAQGGGFDKIGGNTKYTNCNYLFRTYYRYQPLTNIYSWDYNQYSYTNLVYNYLGTNTIARTITETWDYDLTSGNYKASGNLTLNNQDMLIEGNVTLYVAGSFSVSGRSTIVIPVGSSLTIYFGGTVSMSGNGNFDNQNQRAQNLTMFGLPTCTDVSISGNANFVGTLYAPEAAIALRGSGNSNYDIIGAITGKTVDINGKFQIDYPTDLGYSGPAGGFVAQGWLEETVGMGP